MLRRRMMMKKKSEEKNLQWIRLDTLRDWLKPWDTTIINADNPVQTTDRYPIYALAVNNSAPTSTMNIGEMQFFSKPYDELRMSCNNKLIMYVDQSGNLVFPRTNVSQRGFVQQNIEVKDVGTVSNAWVYELSDDSKCYSTDYKRGVVYFSRYQYNASLSYWYALVEL